MAGRLRIDFSRLLKFFIFSATLVFYIDLFMVNKLSTTYSVFPTRLLGLLKAMSLLDRRAEVLWNAGDHASSLFTQSINSLAVDRVCMRVFFYFI